MYVVGDWIKGNVCNLYFGDWCSSPRKEKNSKPTTGENIVPHKQISRVNPNRGKQGGIPEKESPGIANPKDDPSWRQTELILRCQQENSNKYLSLRQKELLPRRQRKQRGIPEKESPGIFIPKGDPIWRQKETISEVLAGQFLRRDNFYVVYNFYVDTSWCQKEIILKCQR